MNCLLTTKRNRRALGATALTALVGVGCSTEQPGVRCQTASEPYALRYTVVEGPPSCADLAGEVGVQAYWRLEPGSSPSVTKGAVAIKTAELGTLIRKYGQTVDSKVVSALGNFMTDEPDAEGFCAVSMSKPSTLKLTAVPARPAGEAGMTDPLPAVEVTLEWSQVRFFVTAAQPGTLFSARLKYSKTTDGETCTATYDVTGLSPYIGCQSSETGPDGVHQPDDGLCDPCADPTMDRNTGSGISPGIDISCNPGTLTCVPRSPLPSLRDQPLQCKT